MGYVDTRPGRHGSPQHLEVELEVLHQRQEHELHITNVEVQKMELELEMMKFKAQFKDPRGVSGGNDALDD